MCEIASMKPRIIFRLSTPVTARFWCTLAFIGVLLVLVLVLVLPCAR